MSNTCCTLMTSKSRVSIIKDLGVWFDYKLNFKYHISVTTAKTNAVLSLIKRFGREFNDVFVIKSLYTSLVLSIIEYGSIVWMPVLDVNINRIESIQKQFLLFILRNMGRLDRFRLPLYRHRLKLLNMLKIRDRQEIVCCTFAFDVLNNNIKFNVGPPFQKSVWKRRQHLESSPNACLKEEK